MATAIAIKAETKKELSRLVFSNTVKGLYSKEELVRDYTNGRTERMGEMLEHEAINLHKYLKAIVSPKNDSKRKYIISHAHTLGWKNEDGTADMARINNWLEHSPKSPFKKRLNALTSAELSKAIYVFEKMAKAHEKEVYNASAKKATN